MPELIRYNIVGALLWVIGLAFAGFYLGNVPMVRENFEKVIMGVIVLSITPIIFQFAKSKLTNIKTS